MKSLFLNSHLLFYSPLLLFILNISDGKAHVSESKFHFSVTKSTVSSKQFQDCYTALREYNDMLKSDPNEILDEEIIDAYEGCLESVIPSLDYKNNMQHYYFLIDCLTNLMDYYDLVEDDQETLETIEDTIYMISID